MRRPVLAAVAAAFAATAAGCGGREREPDQAKVPSGFSARLLDDVRPQGGGLVAWSTDWELEWRPVSGAREYLVYSVTSEGASMRPQHIRKPRLRLSIANGVDRRALRLPRRDQQVSLVAAGFSISVAARLRDGRITPRAGPFPVGERPPG